MKRVTIAPEHKKFFQINGYISFDELVSSEQLGLIWQHMVTRHNELEGVNHDNISRSIPDITKLAHKLGSVAAALLDRKPIRFAFDSFVGDVHTIREIEERELGLLLTKSGRGLFFTERSQLYKESEACYLLLVFTANYTNNPIVFS